ncbi:mannitol-1-phosphate 5-dehydrogenase [Vagococcus acidifermentans]|uniref:Mannitol dehydrogenase n=1 Tax=Vagococcus acidifermentans TaxID=564710 RepID=A0A430ARK8_9ENTE|nr:mannitol-1-phosphate 5-dehydrogenase [Vagococcus acidifermentans]RSU10691.1 mannitol dehydrogenase [Vagococcus acidifermentans]
MRAVHFGAGAIGRGFIGELLHDSGYDITFIDVSEELVNQINKTNSYELYLINHNYEKKIINNVKALSSILHFDQVTQELKKADIITTSVWADNLSKIAPLILDGLIQRKAENKPVVNILACENAHFNSEILKNEILKADFENSISNAIDSIATFPNTAIDRMVFDKNVNGKHVVSIGDDFELVIDSTQLAIPDSKPIKGAIYTDNLQQFLERKLYIINCGHAWAGYIGHLLGYEIIQDVFLREDLVSQVRKTMMESATLLREKYGFEIKDLENYIDFAIRRFQTPGVKDTINRVSRSPIRKLHPSDRLVGPAIQCQKFGLPNEQLLKGIAAALLFFNPQDEQCIEMRKFIQENGIEKAITEYTSITNESSMFQKILNYYHQLREDAQTFIKGEFL